MQLIKIIKKVRQNLIWVWNIAPILLLLEIWALVRVLTIVLLVIGVMLEMVWNTKDHSMCSFLGAIHEQDLFINRIASSESHTK